MCIIACICLVNTLVKITLIMLKEIRNCRLLERHIRSKRKRNEKEKKSWKKMKRCESSLLSVKSKIKKLFRHD